MVSSFAIYHQRRPSDSARLAQLEGKGLIPVSLFMLTVISLSYIPLIAPSTSDARMKFLCGIADSFIYVVSRMGVTGVTGSISSAIPELCAKVHSYAGDVPIAVGFGVSTRADFLAIGENAEGVVIGSQIITTLANAEPSKRASELTKYVASIVGRDITAPTTRVVGLDEALAASEGDIGVSSPTAVITEKEAAGVNLVDQIDALNTEEPVNPNVCVPQIC